MWIENLKKPVVGLAPMDGVTDAAFRRLICSYGKPSFVVTEFVNVEGLARGAIKKIPAFIYSDIERPVVAQVFGLEKDSFYKASVLVSHLGFDGIDINMGCPAKKVERKGAGAGLIRTPELARDIIKSVRRGLDDWSNGITLAEAGVHESVIHLCSEMEEKDEIPSASRSRPPLSLSVKTRIGYDKPVTESWITTLIDSGVEFITLHGRTLRQMYSGQADWEEIAKAARLSRAAGIPLIGNGDISSMDDARNKIRTFSPDGVMVGRAVLGNPWFFSGKIPSKLDRVSAVKLHLQFFQKILSEHLPFHTVKKHLCWYLKGFSGAREIRMEMMRANTIDEAVLLADSIL